MPTLGYTDQPRTFATFIRRSVVMMVGGGDGGDAGIRLEKRARRSFSKALKDCAIIDKYMQ